MSNGNEEIRVGHSITVIGMRESVSAERGAAFTYMLGGREYPCITEHKCHTCTSTRHRQTIEELHLAGIGQKAIHDALPEDCGISYSAMCRHLNKHLPVEILLEWRARKIAADKMGIEEDGHYFTEEHLLDDIQRRVYEAVQRGELKPTINHFLQIAAMRANTGQAQTQTTQRLYEEAFAIYVDETRKLMPAEMFRELQEQIYANPVIRQLDQAIKKQHQEALAATGRPS